MTGREIRIIFIIFFILQLLGLTIHALSLQRIANISDNVDLYFNAPASNTDYDDKAEG